MGPPARAVVVASMVVLMSLVNADAAFALVPNDDVANATVVGSLPFNEVVPDTTDTAAGSEASGTCSGLGHTVWYSFTPSADGPLQADTFGSDFDTVLVAYEDVGGGLQELACNDDSGSSLQSSVSLQLTAGSTYLFQVGGCCESGGETGMLDFSLSATAPFSIDALSVVGAVNPKTGVATIRVTVSCSGQPTDLFVVLELSQRIGRTIVNGSLVADAGTCDGELTFTADVPGANGLFVPGKAFIKVIIESDSGDIAGVEKTIRLQRRLPRTG